MNIKKDNCIEALRRLGMHRPEDLIGDYAQKGIFKLLEEGKVTPEEFYDHIRAQSDGNPSDEQIASAFCEFLLGIPVERLEMLRVLRRNFKIYMLSNTNRIMWNSVIDREFRKEGLCREDYFDGIVTSFDAHCLKPEPAIFEYAIEKLGIKPDETLFLDDSQLNLDAAARLGFQTALIRNS